MNDGAAKRRKKRGATWLQEKAVKCGEASEKDEKVEANEERKAKAEPCEGEAAAGRRRVENGRARKWKSRLSAVRHLLYWLMPTNTRTQLDERTTAVLVAYVCVRDVCVRFGMFIRVHTST